MKKITALLLAAVMLVFLAACGADNGGGAKPADTESGKTEVEASESYSEETQGGVPIDQFAEKYVCIYMDSFGSPLTDLDILKDYTLELKGDGTGVLSLDGIANEFTWKAEAGKIVMTSYTDTVATVDGDVLTIDDWMDQGTAFKFAREGSEAASVGIADPLSEVEQEMIGEWTSYAVVNSFGEDLSGEIDEDTLEMTIYDDRTVEIEVFDEELGTLPWEDLLGTYRISDESYDIEWHLNEDGDLVVTILLDDDSYAVFYCERD